MSNEIRTVETNGITLCFETHGDPSAPPLLLVSGYTAQLISWPDGLVDTLVGRGFHVIRFDNRDSGLSSKSSGPLPDAMDLMARAIAGEDVSDEAPYSLADMAADAVGLMDHLEVDRAHVVGSSMGGMVVQHLAFDHGDRLLSATSIMSTTGDPSVGEAHPEVLTALLAPAPTDRDAAIVGGIEVNRLISGPLWDHQTALERAISHIDRSFHPAGAAFQLAAMAASGNRTERLGSVDCPFLVIHGLMDRLIAVTGGHATAAAVPGADLLVLADMGHDLPEARWPQIASAIGGIAARI